LLGSLVDKSILKRQLKEGSPPRYWLLETMRQYGLDRLRDIGEEAATRKRHFDWICTLGKMAGAWDAGQAEMLQRMSREQDNLWAALEHCVRQPTHVEAGAELARNLNAFWVSRGPFGDVRRILASLTELAAENSIGRARLLWGAAGMALCQNDYVACATLSEESLRIGAEAKDVEAVGWALMVRAVAYWAEGDTAAAAERAESALSLARVMRARQVELNALDALCGILVARGDLDRAIEVGEQGLAMSKDRGELWVRGYLLNYLAQARWGQGDQRSAEALAREAVVCKHAIDDRNGLSATLETLSWMAAELGQHQRAACLVGCADRVRDEISMTLLELYRPQHEWSVSAAVRGSSQRAFDAAFARGRAMTIGEAVAFAVQDKRPSKPVTEAKPKSRTVLTGRQLEIARLIADDLSNRQIADRLFLSERTVETHITNILNKLGLSSRVQITGWVSELGAALTTG
jgi:DNA-binding CsgD family transcriptional regulator